MKYLIMSDLHFEFLYKDGYKRYIRSLSKDADAVIIAGDVSNYNGLQDNLVFLIKHFKPIPILYVHGNHEFYNSSREKTLRITNNLSLQHSNFMPLENKIVNINGQRILGATMWFPDGPMNVLHEWILNDFRAIKDYKKWVYKRNETSVKFFKENIQQGDIVITHHVPCSKSTPQKYKNDNSNIFYYCSMEDVILDQKPNLWVSGHTHSASDYIFGDTRMICNPLGYPHEDTGFIEDLIIEI